MEHSKLPWGSIKESGWGWCVKSEQEYITFKTIKANAAFIVEACNNYDRLTRETKELLEACKEAVTWMDNLAARRILQEAIARCDK